MSTHDLHEIHNTAPLPDVTQLHNLARAEEALINRLDVKHNGYVTPEQLETASHNKGLTADQRHTAEVMIRTQEDLRYQRLGYLPSNAVMGDDTSSAPPAAAVAGDGPSPVPGATRDAAAAFARAYKDAAPQAPPAAVSAGDAPSSASGAPGGDAPGTRADRAGAPRPLEVRPYPSIHQPGSENPDNPNNIRMTDVKAFDRAVDRLSMARDMQSRGPHQLSKDIMTKYAKEDQGKRLTPSDVWSAVGSLSEKPHLTRVEKEELDILKATQNQMRAMWPSGGEPANHHSRAHQNYVEQINRLPLAEADLTRNVNDVIDQYQGNRAVYDTLAVVRNGHHQMIEGDRSPMVEARPLPSPPPIPQPRQ